MLGGLYTIADFCLVSSVDTCIVLRFNCCHEFSFPAKPIFLFILWDVASLLLPIFLLCSLCNSPLIVSSLIYKKLLHVVCSPRFRFIVLNICWIFSCFCFITVHNHNLLVSTHFEYKFLLHFYIHFSKLYLVYTCVPSLRWILSLFSTNLWRTKLSYGDFWVVKDQWIVHPRCLMLFMSHHVLIIPLFLSFLCCNNEIFRSKDFFFTWWPMTIISYYHLPHSKDARYEILSIVHCYCNFFLFWCLVCYFTFSSNWKIVTLQE